MSELDEIAATLSIDLDSNLNAKEQIFDIASSQVVSNNFTSKILKYIEEVSSMNSGHYSHVSHNSGPGPH